MKIISTVSELQKQIIETNITPVGLVPTMGALHEGHLSLAENAHHKCPLVVVSIFVNPNQFNDKVDLKNYPRTPEKDLNLLSSLLRENDIVFIPETKEIYPEVDKREFRFGNLDNVMESRHRPGHFNGVAQVVSRLFEIVNPEFAFFGMKDFQQLAVIKELVRQTDSKVKIIACPIIREYDGLAMSIRNRLLDNEIRRHAGIIFRTISAASVMVRQYEISYIRSFVKNSIEKTPGFVVEYFEIVDDTELIPVTSSNDIKKEKRYYGCIAVKAGKIRLIDNIEFEVD